MSGIHKASQEGGGQTGDEVKRFEVCIVSTQVHDTLVLVSAKDEKEAKRKALNWEYDDILDTCLQDQRDQVAAVEEADGNVG